MRKSAIQIFLKAPEPGKVKTRLIPDLGVQGATAIHKKLVQHVLSIASLVSVEQVQCWVSGDLTHPFIAELGKTFSVHEQQGDDLGEKMQYALTQGLRDYDQVLLIGADAYSIDQKYILNALQALDHRDMVFGPALDGGYILVGAKKLDQFVFSDIEWGTERVLEQQLERLDKLNVTYGLLDERWDIDEISDIKQFAPELLSQLEC